MFPDLTKRKTYHWLFHRHCSSKVFQTLHYYNLAWGVPIHTRFEDLVSMSQVCQSHNLQIMFLDLRPA